MRKSSILTTLIPSWGLAFSLLIVLIALVLFSLITISDLIAPFFMEVKDVLLEESIQPESGLQAIMIFKFVLVIVMFYVMFILYAVSSAIHTYNSLRAANKRVAPAEVNLENLIFRTINWNVYRLILILKPPMVISIVSLTLFLSGILFFNWFLSLAGISLGATVFVSILVAISLLFGFIASFILSIWHFIISAFGMEIAISEPGLSNKVIRARSEKLVFVKRENIALFALGLFFVFLLFAQFISVIVNGDILNSENIFSVLLIILLDIAFYVGLRYMKASCYANSLLYQFNKIKTVTGNLPLYM
ncbi:MAG: hypothetical protein ACD_20C00084G0021 [uncultured bacterium]|nr:MAG: hypothetical protein ACD_20C00084G0021 [uncultured bacterium]HBH18801.1 hypothetical protein [Cyanobacteria bacterium UBA9579]